MTNRRALNVGQACGVVWVIGFLVLVGFARYYPNGSHASSMSEWALIPFPAVCLILTFGLFRAGTALAFISLFVATLLVAVSFSSRPVQERDLPINLALLLLLLLAPFALIRAVSRKEPPRDRQ